MDLLRKEERESLIIEYNHLHDEVWRRAQITWLTNSILVVGSLLIVFSASGNDFPVASLVLVVTSFILHVTNSRIDQVCYERMHAIGSRLGIDGPKEMYEVKIEGKWWYLIRRNLWHFLFVFLIGTYLSLIFVTWLLLIITLYIGIPAIVIAEANAYFKRKAQNRKCSK